MPDAPSDAELLAYLDEAAPPAEMSTIEEALRQDDGLRERVARLVAGRDAGLHSLGEVWRRRRLTCPSREQLGSHLLGVLPDAPNGGLAGYVRFHLEVVGCRSCLANLADLRARHAEADDAAPRRRGRYFESSVGRLGDEG